MIYTPDFLENSINKYSAQRCGGIDCLRSAKNTLRTWYDFSEYPSSQYPLSKIDAGKVSRSS
ncbi:hypothetical protein ACE1CA_26285 [Aerosakkonemataceae cyanobacterium BLCC-F167]|uniref:Uncharacterized protein n=1 Tax=Floridaenema evergladense BLCC-F167 TaxID=3153639 RepID=A0ABV4WSG3_9CYAN